MRCFAHFVHVNGELGDVDNEEILGPLDYGVQLTYKWLRDCENGDNIAEFRNGEWWTTTGDGPFSDVHFTADLPDSVLMEPLEVGS